MLAVLTVGAASDVDGHVDDCAASEDGAAEQRHRGDLFCVPDGGQEADGDHGQEGGEGRRYPADLGKAGRHFPWCTVPRCRFRIHLS